MQAAWYDDPVDPTRKRYWDGRSWTQNILLPGPAPVHLPPPGSTPPSPPDAIPAVAGVGTTAQAGESAVVRAAQAPTPHASLTTQQLLLGLGGALILTAVIAFIAFIWGTVGPYGQAGILSLVALCFGVAAVRIRTLTATRETFAVISWGIFAILVGVGPSFGFLPADLFTDLSFATAALLSVVTALTMGAALRWRFTVLRLIGWATYVLTVLVAIAAVQNGLDVQEPAALWSVGLAAAAAATLLVPRPVTAWCARAAVVLLLTGMTGVPVVAVVLVASVRSPAAGVAILVVAGIAASASRLSRAPLIRAASLTIASATLGAAAGVLLGLVPSAPWEAALIALVGCLATAVTYARRSWTGVVLSTVMWLTWLIGVTQTSADEDELLWAVTVFLTVVALSALVFSVVSALHDVVFVFAGAGWLAATLYLALTDVDLVEAYAAASLVIVVIMLVVLRRAGTLAAARFRELAIAAVLLATVPSALAAVIDPSGPDTVPLHLVIGLGGIAGAFAWAAVDRRVRPVAWPAACLLTLTIWSPIGEILPGEPTVEYITLTAAASFLAAAWIALSRRAAGRFSIVAVLVVSAVHTLVLWSWLLDREQSDGIPFLPPLTIAIVALGLVTWEWLALRREVTAGYWVAAFIVLVTAWIPMLEGDVESAGHYGVILACAYLLASVPTLLRHRELNSMVWLAPAVLAATTPYTLEYGVDAGRAPMLFVVVLAVAVVLSVVGGLRGIGGLFVPGIVNVAVIVVAQIVFVVGIVPVWVTLAVGGAALLAVGVRLEWTRIALRTGTTWVRALE